MKQDISYYCRKYKCGLCCERGWTIFATEEDVKRWEKEKPEILDQVTTRIIDGIEKKVIKKRPFKFPNGKTRDLCVFYDFEKKCTIHDVNPEMCRKFSCMHHVYFIFQLVSKISELIGESKVKH